MQTLRVDFPFLRRGSNQHQTRSRSGFTESFPLRRSAGAATSHLNAEHRMVIRGINWSRLYLNLAPVSFQFFRNEHRQGRIDSLAHLRFVTDDGYAVIRVDPDNSV